MNEDFGADLITIVDDDGQEFELEVVGRMDYNGKSYALFLPADIDEMDEDDPDYGFIILKSVMEGDEELLDSVDMIRKAFNL